MVTPLLDFGDTGVEINVRTFRAVQLITDLLVVRFEANSSTSVNPEHRRIVIPIALDVTQCELRFTSTAETTDHKYFRAPASLSDCIM